MARRAVQQPALPLRPMGSHSAHHWVGLALAPLAALPEALVQAALAHLIGGSLVDADATPLPMGSCSANLLVDWLFVQLAVAWAHASPLWSYSPKSYYWRRPALPLDYRKHHFQPSAVQSLHGTGFYFWHISTESGSGSYSQSATPPHRE